MFKTVQIIDILNSSKNREMKWSVHSEKGKFTREVAGNLSVIFRFIANGPKISKYRSCSAV